MRAIDADELKKKECSECQFHTEECPADCGVMERIDSMPTVEAITVEQVARILHKLTDEAPCVFGFACENENSCSEERQTDEELCWLHAIGKGWLL